MSSIIKVNTFQDANGNALFSSDGSGNVTMSANGVKNTPSFFANKTSAQTITSNTYTKITFDSEVFDTDSAFDLANDKFTVPTGQAGKYFISAVIQMDANAVTQFQYGNLAIYKNGSQKVLVITDSRNNTSYQHTLNITYVDDLSVGDYLEVYGRISDLSGSPQINGASDFQSYFYGYRLIGA